MKMKNSLVAILESQAAKYGSKEIYYYLNSAGQVTSSLSFLQLRNQAKGWASFLSKKYSDKPAAILLFPACSSFISGYFACLYSGKIAVPMAFKPGDTKNDVFINLIRLIKEKCKSNLILVDPSFENEIKSNFKKEFIVESLRENEEDESFFPMINKYACSLFTSGSTSQPKGITLTHENILDNSISFTKDYGYDQETITLSWLPHFHAFGMLLNFYYPLVSGTSVYLMPTSEFVNNPISWLDNASKYNATHLAAPDFGFRLIAKELEVENNKDWKLGQVKYAFSSSEPVQKDSFDRFYNVLQKYGLKEEALSAMYGMSEASVISCQRKQKLTHRIVNRTLLERSVVEYVKEGLESAKTIVSCGQVISSTILKIVDPSTFNECKSNEIGELWIAGPSIFEGYIEEKDNIDAWGKIPGQEGTRYFRTGDSGFENEGEIYLTGRIKEMILVNGKNYYPIDIEHTVTKAFPELKDYRKAAFSTVIEDHQIVGLVLEIPELIVDENLQEIAEEITSKVLQNNGVLIHNVAFVAVNQIPRTSTGKVQRKKCSTLLFNNELEVYFKSQFNDSLTTESIIDLTNEEEQILDQLYDLFKEVLNSNANFTPVTKFYAIGVSSIELMRINDRIQRLFNKNIQVFEILKCDHFLALAKKINEETVSKQQDAEIVSGKGNLDENLIPLTSNQKGMLFEILKDQQSNQFNIPLVYDLGEDIELGKLEKSFKQLQLVHPILNSRIFVDQAGNARQELSKIRLNLKVEETKFDRSYVRKRIDEIISKPIFPSRFQPLVEVFLFIHAEGHTLFFHGSHLILDGLSCQKLIEDWIAIYNERNVVGEIAFARLNQHERKAILKHSEYVETLLNDWNREVFNEVALPYELNTGVDQKNKWGINQTQISITIQNDINDCIRTLNVTKASFYISVFALALRRFARKPKMTIGTAFLNRLEKEFEKSVGYFANMLPILVNANDSLSFEALNNEVLKNMSFIMPLQNYPLPEFLKKIKGFEAEDSIFQAILLFQKGNEVNKIQDSFVKKQDYSYTQNSTGDLTFDIIELEENSILSVKYNTQKLSSKTISLILNNFFDVLIKVIKNPKAHLKDLMKITEMDQRLISNLNSNKSKLEPCKNIYEKFKAKSNSCFEKVAIRTTSNELSYFELSSKVDALATVFSKKGLKRGSVVSLYIERCEWLPISILALLKIGATYIPIDPNLTSERVKYINENSGSTALLQLSSKPFNAADIDGKEIITLDRENYDFQLEDDDQTSIYEDTNNVFVIYTSGSTGNPKGVEINHLSLVNFIEAMQETPGLVQEDHLLAVSTVSFDIAFTELILPLMIGATITIASEDQQKNGEELLSIIENSRISFLQCTPVTWKLLLEAGLSESSNLSKGISTGEALTSDVAGKILECGIELWNMYGPSEGTIETTYAKVIQPNGIAIGKPIMNVELFVLDENLNQVPVGALGELYIAGLNLANGYKGLKNLTQEKFLPIPSTIPSAFNLMYKTGDVVKLLEDGQVYYFGRNDFQVKVRGYRIELAEIESVAKQVECIKDACALVDQTNDNPSIKLCIVPRKSALIENEFEFLTKRLGEKLPNYMLPHSYYVRNELPLLPNGKVDRNRLFENGYNPLMEKQQKQSREITENPESILGIVKQAWEKVIDKPVDSYEVNFFDAGGDSIMILQLKKELEKIDRRINIKTTQLFKYPTIISQAEWLTTNNEKDIESKVQIESKEKIDIPTEGYIAIFKN